MNTEKKLGIWMDHSSAHLIEFIADPMETVSVDTDFSGPEKEGKGDPNENLMHNKEQHQQAGYYRQLGEIICKYKGVVLFGPTEAKSQLFNILRADHEFESIKIDVEQADKMTKNQQHAFVKNHFNKH